MSGRFQPACGVLPRAAAREPDQPRARALVRGPTAAEPAVGGRRKCCSGACGQPTRLRARLARRTGSPPAIESNRRSPPPPSRSPTPPDLDVRRGDRRCHGSPVSETPGIAAPPSVPRPASAGGQLRLTALELASRRACSPRRWTSPRWQARHATGFFPSRAPLTFLHPPPGAVHPADLRAMDQAASREGSGLFGPRTTG
jgi:hypothetical protein